MALKIKLKEVLKERKEKISKAKKVRSLLQKSKGLWKTKQSLTDFKEPVMDLHRRNGQIETYESATAGKFIFTHSNGEDRFIELRPADQETRDYGGKKVRWYTCHEDRPFAGWDNPINDSESIALGYEKTKATDLKYQERIQKLKNQSKWVWVWVILAIVGAFILATMLVPETFWDRLFKTGSFAKKTIPPNAGLILLKLKGKFK